jgi:hypothetical protein
MPAAGATQEMLQVLCSKRERTMIMRIGFILLIIAVQTYSNRLEYVGRISDDSATVNGLAGAQCVLVSNDDKHIYVAGENDHSICWFTRFSNGDIEYSGRVKNDKILNVAIVKYSFPWVLSRTVQHKSARMLGRAG